MRRRCVAGLMMASALCQATSALAQSADEQPLFLGTLRIESADAQALLGNDEITEEEIEARNPSSTKDVFAGESSVTASGGAAIGQKVFVNGIEESLLSVTIDGARQNKSAFHHTGNVLLDPELLKAVEISRGLAPADAGAGALAGAIAYETKDAADLLDEGDDFGGYFKLGASANGDGLEGALALYGMSGGLEYVLSATRRDSDDYEDGDDATVVGTGADLADYVGKVAFTAEAGYRLAFAASQTEDTGQRAAQAGPGGILFIRPDFFGVVGRESVMTPGLSRRTSYTLTVTNEQPQGIWDPTIQLSSNDQEIDASGVYGINTSFSGTVKNRFQIASGTITAGADFFRESAEGQGRGPGPFGSSGKEEMQNIGALVQVRQDVGDRVSLSYGGRYDAQEFTGADGSGFSDSDISANGSVDVILSDTWTLNAGLASSWGGYELGEAALVNFGAAWDYIGFTTSRANAGRVGLRFDNGTWKASAALFRTDVEDISAVLPTMGARGATADLSSQGVDASVQYDWAAGFAKVNWTHADVELDGDAVGSTAYYLGRPVGDVVALETGWDVTPEWRVGGTAEIALENDDAAKTLPAYQMANAYVTYRPTGMKNLEVRFDVRNAFDESYVSRSSDGIDNARVVPLNEPGRTLAVTTKVRF